MISEFTKALGFDFISFFGKEINVPVRDNFLEIPKTLGTVIYQRLTHRNPISGRQ